MKRLVYLAVFTMFMTTFGAVINARPKSADNLITETSVGKLKLGMTVAEARKVLNGMTLKRTSDGEGAVLIAVDRGKDAILTIYAGEDDFNAPINENAIIEFIEVWSKDFQTAKGVRVGMKIGEVEKSYGKVKEILISEIESREFVEFVDQPKGLMFRSLGDEGAAGNYEKEERKTTEYLPNGYLFSIQIMGANPFDENFKPDQNAYFSSTYTNLDKDCASSGGEDGGHVSTVCKDIGSYRINYFDSAAALHFSVGPLASENSISLATQPLGYDVKTRKIEWRMANGRPFAVIMRINKFEVTDEGIPGKITGEYLIVKGLENFEKIDFEIDAKTKNANEEARKLADGGYLKN